MNGDVRTSKQAARSSWVVRLVSFGAATLLIAVLLLAAAMMRYGLEREATPAEAEMVSEAARPPPPQRTPAPEPRRVVESAEPPAAPVAAQTPIAQDAEPPLITQPVWVQRPRNTARYYPREAFMQGVDGQVVLDCFVEVDGALTCSIASETPPDRGFGAAALAIAAAHVMQPAMRDGAPVRARYQMRVPFSASS